MITLSIIVAIALVALILTPIFFMAGAVNFFAWLVGAFFWLITRWWVWLIVILIILVNI